MILVISEFCKNFNPSNVKMLLEKKKAELNPSQKLASYNINKIKIRK